MNIFTQARIAAILLYAKAAVDEDRQALMVYGTYLTKWKPTCSWDDLAKACALKSQPIAQDRNWLYCE